MCFLHFAKREGFNSVQSLRSFASHSNSSGNATNIMKSNLLCTHCHKRGHVESTCWTKYPHLKDKSSAETSSNRMDDGSSPSGPTAAGNTESKWQSCVGNQGFTTRKQLPTPRNKTASQNEPTGPFAKGSVQSLQTQVSQRNSGPNSHAPSPMSRTAARHAHSKE